MKRHLGLGLCTLAIMACNSESGKIDSSISEDKSIREQLIENYDQMPEKEIILSADSSVYAQYAMPTEKYGHGILGDKVEAEQLVVVVDSEFYELTLDSDYVFEDISPRLYDVDGDDELEFITIRTHVSKGAALVIYKLTGERLVEYAHVPEIGTAYRWLNMVAINDFDNDGTVEIAWIQTPHIGGVLKVAKVKTGLLQVLDEKLQYSNHAIGQRNLCLSVLTAPSHQKILYVPNQGRNKLIGLTLEDNKWQVLEEINLTVDFSIPLASQYTFSNTINNGNNCHIND